MGCNFGQVEAPPQILPHKRFQRRFQAVSAGANSIPISRPDILSRQKLNQDTKSLVWDIIQRDSLKQFVYLMQEQKIPIDIQIQGKGTYWSLAHLAARWDAHTCLKYIILNYFDEHSNDFIKFINLQTSEGLSPLSLSIVWNSINCFHLLLNFGGIDLTLKDTRSCDVFAIAASYKRAEMKNRLDNFQRNGVSLISLNLKQLKNIPQPQAIYYIQQPIYQPVEIYTYQFDTNSQKYQQNFKQRQQQVIISHQIQLQELYNDQNNYHDYYYEQSNKNNQLKYKYILQDQNYQLDQDENYAYAIRLDDDYQEVNQDYKKLQDQQKMRQFELRKKQDEYIQQQIKLQQQKDLEIQKLIQQQKELELKKILQYQNQKRQEYNRNQQNENQKIIEEQRQLLKKNLQDKKINLQNQNNQPLQNEIKITEQPNINNCPSEFRELYTNLVNSKKNFVDSTFYPRNQTIGSGIKVTQNMRNSIWLRPNQIFKGNYQLFDGINPNDIKQGELGVCYYLSTIASLAQNQKRIRDLFVFHNKELGFYVIKFYVHGIPKNIVVDDYFPCIKGTNEPIFTKPNGKQIWVMILEKAWAKNFGNYISAASMSPDAMMEDVQGAPSKGCWIKDPQKQFDNMLNYDALNYIMVLTSLSQNVPPGIVKCHAYSILSVFNINGLKLLKIRNPWGNFEQNGEYGTNSKKWTAQLKKKVGFVADQNDGQFFMTLNQLPLAFNYYSVGMVKDNYKYSYMKFNSNFKQDCFFAFNIPRKIQVNIRIVQLFDRFLPDPSYKYSPVVIQVYKINGPESVIFISQGSSDSIWGGKAIQFHQNGYLTLQPGLYNMRIRMHWTNSNKYNTATIVSYGQEALTFSKLQNAQAMKNWKNMLRDVMKSVKTCQITKGLVYSQLWTKSAYVYFVKNTNNKDYEVTFTFDLSNFKNTCLGLKKKDTNKLVMKVRKVNGSNVGTVQKIVLVDGCSIGTFRYTFTQI